VHGFFYYCGIGWHFKFSTIILLVIIARLPMHNKTYRNHSLLKITGQNIYRSDPHAKFGPVGRLAWLFWWKKHKPGVKADFRFIHSVFIKFDFWNFLSQTSTWNFLWGSHPRFDPHRSSTVSSGRASGIKVLQRSNKF